MKERHLWLVNHYAQEPGSAGGTRHYSIAKHLKEFGWNTTIIAASVELNTGRQRLSRRCRHKRETRSGVDFLWIRTSQHRGNGVGRMWNMLLFSLRLLVPSVTRTLHKPDVIVGSSVHPFAAWSAAQLAKRLGVAFVFEVRDLWPKTLIDLGRLREGAVSTSLLQWLEVRLYTLAKRIIVLLPLAEEYIVPLGIDRSKIAWIPNGVELDGVEKPAPNLDSNTFTFMYFGAHGTANSLDTVLHAMALLEQRNGTKEIRLRLIGDGPEKRRLKELANDLGLCRVTFEPAIPKSEIPVCAAQADAFVFNLVDAPVFKYGVSSNKLFDYLAAARPVIFCCNAGNNPVFEAGAGITVRPGRPKELAMAMVRMASMPLRERVEMGYAGYEYVQSCHSYKALARRFSDVLSVATAREPQSPCST